MKAKPEYWILQCPHCMVCGYYRFHGPGKWPIVGCRCGKFFSHWEVDLMIFTVCEPVPSERVSALVRRQAVDVYPEEGREQ